MYGFSKGELLNNPCNIRKSTSNWQGKLTPGKDKDFETFVSSQDGIRAAAKIFINYYKLYHLSTITDLISRWAPQADNNPTSAYIAFVAKSLAVDSKTRLNLLNADVLVSLIKEVITEESGHMTYADADIKQAVSEALS